MPQKHVNHHLIMNLEHHGIIKEKVVIVVVVEVSETCQTSFDQELGAQRHHKHSEHI
jgi:hypothetical protein